MLYGGRDEGQLCSVTAPAAKLITGVVFCAGAHWIRPDFRGFRLSHLLARLNRAYAVARWPVDWCVAIVAPVLVDKGVADGHFLSGCPVGRGRERPHLFVGRRSLRGPRKVLN
jgi:hypothetical protein